MKDNFNLAIIALVLVGIIIVAGSHFSTSRQPPKPSTTTTTLTTSVESEKPLFISLSFNGEKEFVIDCSYFKDSYCAAGVDTEKGWVRGPISQDDFEKFYKSISGFSTVSNSNLVLVDNEERKYLKVEDEELINNFVQKMQGIVFNASENIRRLATDSEKISSYLEKNEYSTFFLEPAFLNNEPVWRFGIGSPISPEIFVYISFDGSKVLQ